MSSDEVETFEVFDPMVLEPENAEVESLIEDVTPSATRPSVALRSPPGTSVYCWIASELCGGVIGKSTGERFCCKPAE
eukprot:scaffold35837_cov31-Attheya_sp.AAC.1